MTREPSPAMKLLLDHHQHMIGPEVDRIRRLLWIAIAVTLVANVIGLSIDSAIPPLLSCLGTGWVAIKSMRWERRLRRLAAEIDQQAQVDEEERQEQRREGFRMRLREVIRPEDKAR